MTKKFFTSEAVSRGHPDKLADQIADALLDSYLANDPEARVDCGALVSKDLIVVTTDVSSDVQIDIPHIIYETMRNSGYETAESGWNYSSCQIITRIKSQSLDIAAAVDPLKNASGKLGAGDQGVMFGYACNETDCLMPLPIVLANAIINELQKEKQSGTVPFLLADAKSQVTVEYDLDGFPKRVDAIVFSCQHTPVPLKYVQRALEQIVRMAIPAPLIDENTRLYLNPSGSFIIGGPVADTGLTGRKQLVDAYGSNARIGGGAFSGKDPTKVDRSAAYAARHIAKNIVAAKLAMRCEVELAYAIGLPQPISVWVDTFGTSSICDEELTQNVNKIFDLSVEGIIERLQLRRPIYAKTAYGGHFGKSDPDYTWEKIIHLPIF